MPHDRDANELRVGDRVNVPCRIKAIHQTEHYCNVDLETLMPMPPTESPSGIALNAHQVVLAPEAFAKPVTPPSRRTVANKP